MQITFIEISISSCYVYRSAVSYLMTVDLTLATVLLSSKMTGRLA
jgi:hypothetical protein